MEKLNEFTETLRIKKSTISAHLLAISGKEYDSFIFYAPTLNISGYGNTKKEAEEMFKESFNDFASHFMSLSTNEREAHLFKLGFTKEKLKSKNFSKSYVDENGELQNLSLENKSFELTNLVA